MLDSLALLVRAVLNPRALLGAEARREHRMFSNADVARCRSTAYRVLACAFSNPENDLDREVRLRGAALLPDLLEACGARKLRRLARRLAHTSPSPELHRRLFTPAAACEAPPYATSYANGPYLALAHELAMLGAFLADLMDTLTNERGDHVTSECEMMSFLASEEAEALDRRDENMIGLAREAESAFLRDHLSHFAPVFGERVGLADPDGFYGGMGRVLQAFVEWDCTRHGVDVPAYEFRASS